MAVFYIPQMTVALTYAADALKEEGFSFQNKPENYTHVLLPIPTDKALITNDYYGKTIIGGNLPPREHCIDLLKNEAYLTENAAITADCTETLIRSKLPCGLSDCNVLIIGWGRIGKCLAKSLSRCVPDIAVCSESYEKRCLCKALGFTPVEKESIHRFLPKYRVIINTAPTASPISMDCCRKDALCIDLASVSGIAGSNVIWARGLPGKMEPEASGRLIGKTIKALLKEGC